MTFDPTITLGIVIQSLLLFVGLFAGYNSISNRIAQMETKVEAMWVFFMESVKGK